jgi:CRISPR-associated protein Csm4
MKLIKLNCKPGAKFHLGKIALDSDTGLDDTSEWIHSDTLFSALVNTVNSIAPAKTQDFVDLFIKGEIRISSAFYCLEIKRSEPIYFLPTPVTASNMVTQNYKDIKKIRFVSKAIWEQGIAPEKWTSDECVIINKKFVCKATEVNILKEKRLLDSLSIYDVITEPKVKVHTQKHENRLYQQTSIQLECNPIFTDITEVHFYFLIEGFDKFPSFDSVLRVLGDTGIGGERSTGCGQFSFDKEQEFKLNIDNTKQWSNVALLYPKSEEDFKTIKYYQFITRGGRHTGVNNEYLKRVRMISEGAICKKRDIICDSPNVAMEGATVPSYRYGQGLLLPLHENFCRYE